MLCQLKSYLRTAPLVSPMLRSARRRFFPNETDLWAIHTQAFEHYLRQTTKLVANPVFVKVGANDGLSGDPCGREFIDSSNWTGVLIEPVPSCFANLSLNYPDRKRFVLEQIAIGSQPGRTKFYYVSDDAKANLPELPEHYDMLGSFDRAHIVNHLDGILEPYIVEFELEVQTLAEVLSRNKISHVELLHIDTEGFDLEVLRSLDFGQVSPRAIYIEHKHLCHDDKGEMLACLTNQNYRVVDCGNDFFAEQVDAGRLNRQPQS